MLAKTDLCYYVCAHLAVRSRNTQIRSRSVRRSADKLKEKCAMTTAQEPPEREAAALMLHITRDVHALKTLHSTEKHSAFRLFCPIPSGKTNERFNLELYDYLQNRGAELLRLRVEAERR